MGTRSTITFVEKYKENETPLVTIYQQYDGYIDGVGHELATWLCGKKLVNGFNRETMDKYANGVGCLAAQFIKEFKTDIGGLYIVPMDDEQSYNYRVVVDTTKHSSTMEVNDLTTIIVTGYDEEFIFKGTPKQLAQYVEEE